MARKKSVRRKPTRNVRKSSKKIKKTSVKYKSGNLHDKIRLVITNLLLFVALSLVGFVLNRYIENTFLKDLFQIIAIVFGFIGVGFLLVLLILEILKLVSKKK
jgi:hypothetical protein